MFWISVLIFIAILVSLLAGYFLVVPQLGEKKEIRKRLSLLELRRLRVDDLPAVLKSELLSDIPLFNRILVHFNIAVKVDKQLKQANIEMKVGTFFLISCFFFVCGMFAGSIWRFPFLFSVLFGLFMFSIPFIVVNVRKRKRVQKFIQYFPETLEMFSRSLRAGHSFTGAIQLVAQEMPDPIGPEFQKVFDEQNLGIPLRTALVGLTDRNDLLDVKFFVTAILIQRETGGNLAEIIDKIAYVIRERFRVQGQLKIFTAQARMSGTVLAFLPLSVAIVLYYLNPGYMKPLWEDPIGRFMILGAVIFQILGMLVIRKIIRIKI